MLRKKNGQRTEPASPPLTIRALDADDLEAVVAIDREHSGGSRRGFFEKRLHAAERDPQGFVYVGAVEGERLAGFALARLVGGEFGAEASAAVLDAIGVDPPRTEKGIGRTLLRALDDVLRRKGVRELDTEAEWTNDRLLRFLAAAGFRRAPRIVLERDTSAPLATFGAIPADDPEEPRAAPERESPFIPPRIGDPDEIDYGGEGADDFAALARDEVPVRSLAAADLPHLVAIDRRITGRDRTPYYERKVAEALKESGVRVSLVAESAGRPRRPVGFIMARVDFGEFGRTDPEAVIDTIGVDPDHARRRIGSALLSQLLANLAVLRVERVRTEVAWNAFGLQAFLERAGFRPSERIALRRPLP